MAATRGRPFAVLAVVLLVGCSDGSSASKSGKSERLRTVVSMHSMMHTMTGRPPADEQQFKKFITEKGGPMIERAGAANVDELFVSERDGQPFVVLYKRPAGMTSDIIVYERNGVDGKRIVGHSIGAVEEVDETKFRTLVPEGAAP